MASKKKKESEERRKEVKKCTSFVQAVVDADPRFSLGDIAKHIAVDLGFFFSVFFLLLLLLFFNILPHIFDASRQEGEGASCHNSPSKERKL